jgi:hypothetical protein
MTHSMRNDGERGGPRHLCDRCSYEERVDSAWTGASVAQDFRGYGQAGIVPAYVREEEGCARD